MRCAGGQVVQHNAFLNYAPDLDRACKFHFILFHLWRGMEEAYPLLESLPELVHSHAKVDINDKGTVLHEDISASTMHMRHIHDDLWHKQQHCTELLQYSGFQVGLKSTVQEWQQDMLLAPVSQG